MTRIKSKTPTAPLRQAEAVAAAPRVRAAKPNTVAARLAMLDDLVARAHKTCVRAELLENAITGDNGCGELIARADATPASLIAALAAVGLRLAQTLDRCDAALEKARVALG